MKTQQIFKRALTLLIFALFTTPAFANTKRISEERAIEIAKSHIDGKFLDLEYDKMNTIEVRLKSNLYGIVEVYMELATGEVLMIENEDSEFGVNIKHKPNIY